MVAARKRVAKPRKAPIKEPAPKLLLPDEFIFANQVDPRIQDWLWHQVIPAGALTIVAGAPGVSKSSLLIHVAAQVTKGILDGDLKGKPQNVLYLSREDSPEKSLVPKLMAADAWSPEDLHNGDGRVIFLHPQRAANMSFPADVSKLAQMIKTHSIGVVVLDSLMSFMETKRSLHGNYQAAVESMTPLAEMCAKAGVTLIGVMHLRKDADTAGLNSIIGSIGISATARHVVMVGEAPMTESKIIGVVKSNLGPELVGVVYDVSWKAVATDEDGRKIYGSAIEVVRPATQNEIANMLEKRKSAHNDAQQLVVLAAMVDGEEQTTKELYAVVGNEVGVQYRQFRRILEKLVALGLVEENIKGDGLAPGHVITGRGKVLVSALAPVEEDEEPSEEDEASPRRKITIVPHHDG